MATHVDLTSDEVIDSFMEEVETQSDRGAAIVAASVLEALLGRVLIDRLVPLSKARRERLFDGPNKPLSTFSAKIEMAFALGLFPEAHRLLFDGIRKTRNKFAHEIVSLKFDDPDIDKLVRSLGAPRVMRRKSVSTRDQFLSLFHVAATSLFGILAVPNIRIEPVWKTHKAELSEYYNITRELIESALRKAEAKI